MSCPSCRADLPNGAAFCPLCGVALAATGPTQRLSSGEQPASEPIVPPSESLPSCARCGGEMEIGFMPEMVDGGGITQSLWVVGEPKRSRWLGISINNQPCYVLEGRRCNRCGGVDLYARRPFKE